MKEEKGITLVALAVTIIILIILAGISINTLVGENGIITKAKQSKQNIVLAGEAEALQLNQLYYELETGGELTEDEESTKKDEIITLLQKQVEELQNQVKNLTTENEDLKQQIADLTTQIGTLQTEIEALKEQISQKDIEIEDLKAQVSEKEAKIQELQNQLNNINSLLAQTNATAAQILSGYKAYSGGKLVTGTMVNRGAVSSSLNCGQSYTIPVGYHNGSGKVTANSLASQTQATATANNLSNGVTAWVNGVKITGNGTDVNNAWSSGHTAGYNEGISAGGKILKLLNNYTITINNTANTYTFSATSVSNYKNLTKDNFFFNVTGVSAGTSTALSQTATLSYSYNSSTGKLTISTSAFPYSSEVVGLTGNLYVFYQ